MASGGSASALQKSEHVRHPLARTELDVLARSRLFSGVARQRLSEGFHVSGEINLRAGSALLDLGQRHAAIYVLVSGRLAVYLDEDAKIPVRHVEPGDCLGEICLIDPEATTASVVAVQPSRVLFTTPGVLWRLMHEDQRIALNLVELFAERVGSDNAALLSGQQAKPRMITDIDPVTGLHNRRWFNDMFLRQIDRCAREGKPVCMALIDIDHFKGVNETFGHQAGDLVLAQVARILQRQLRPGDLLARHGHDVFAVLFPATKVQAGMAALERLRLAVQRTQTSVAQRTTVKVQISAGVSAWREGWSLDELSVSAGEALRAAKSSGRNCIMVAQMA